MRSNVLLASVLALGAVAKPVDRRYIVTEVDVEVVTKTVYVTAGAPAPTAESYPQYGHGHGHGSKSKSKSSSKASSSAVYVPPPTSTPKPTPTEVYTPPAVTEVPSSAAPVSSEAPASSAAPSYGEHKSGAVQATFSSGPDYEAACTYHHNAVRANHNAPELVWDDATAQNALWSANQCVFKHQFPEGVSNGQNIFTSSGSSFNVTAAIVESWYKSELPPMLPYFGQNSIPDSVFHSVGHLTAMVWKSTTKFGCASVDCSGKMTMEDGSSTDMGMFTVCNYADDVPNMADQYAANVLAPINSNPTLSWSD